MPLSAIPWAVQPILYWIQYSGQNTVGGSHSLLQGIFPTQGSNPGLLHCRQILYQLSHQGSPRILEWVVYPFSRESSRPSNQTAVFWIVGNSSPAEVLGKPLIRPLPIEYAYVCAQSFSRVWLFETPWTVVCQASLSMAFSRQECWSCHFLLQGIFLTQESNHAPVSSAL